MWQVDFICANSFDPQYLDNEIPPKNTTINSSERIPANIIANSENIEEISSHEHKFKETTKSGNTGSP